jgi:adenylate kinase
MEIIIISGTPGTGKSTVSKQISEMIDAKIISLNELAISEKLTLQYDKKRETYIVDFDKLIPYLINLIESFKNAGHKFLIIEGHFADIVPNEFINYAIVLRCDPEQLSNRLKKRGYKREKVRENVQAEILGNCVNYLIQKQINSPTYEIDTTLLTIESIAKTIIDLIIYNKNVEGFKIGKVDWLEKLAYENNINEFFDK